MNIDRAELAVRVVAEDHVVVELHERVTAPCPALELHVVIDCETGAASASTRDLVRATKRPSDAGESSRAAAKDPGCDDLAGKPFTPEILVAIVEAALRLRKAE